MSKSMKIGYLTYDGENQTLIGVVSYHNSTQTIKKVKRDTSTTSITSINPYHRVIKRLAGVVLLDINSDDQTLENLEFIVKKVYGSIWLVPSVWSSDGGEPTVELDFTLSMNAADCVINYIREYW